MGDWVLLLSQVRLVAVAPHGTVPQQKPGTVRVAGVGSGFVQVPDSAALHSLLNSRHDRANGLT